MRSILRDALLATRLGTAPRRGSLDLVWAALTPGERARLEREVAVLTAHGVRVATDSRNPLFHIGPFESIGPRVLAVCGQAQARASGVELAELAARRAADAGATVIAGDTEGPETAAVAAALDAGGLAVTVLADGFAVPGLRRTGAVASRQATVAEAGARHSGLGSLGDAAVVGRHAGLGSPEHTAVAGTHVVVSPCAPGQPWSVDAAMARNATIARRCTVLVAIGAGSSGATLDAGMRALAEGRPVLAVGSTPGSRLLVDYGATAAVDGIELAWWLDTRLPASAAARARCCADGARKASASRPDGRASWHPPARRWSTA